MANQNDHSCTANAQPIIDDARDGEPILSATIGDTVEVYCKCRECGEEITLEYEYVDAFATY